MSSGTQLISSTINLSSRSTREHVLKVSDTLKICHALLVPLSSTSILLKLSQVFARIALIKLTATEGTSLHQDQATGDQMQRRTTSTSASDWSRALEETKQSLLASAKMATMEFFATTVMMAGTDQALENVQSALNSYGTCCSSLHLCSYSSASSSS